MNAISLRPSQAACVLAIAIENRKPVLLAGAPGVGKTAIVHEAAQVAGADVLLSYPAIEDPTDAKGLPWLDAKTGTGEFIPLGALKKAVEAKRPTLWCLEDLGQASEAVQAAYMSVLSKRTVGSHQLPDHVTIMATTNGKEHRAGVRGLLEPVKSRFSTILNIQPTLDDWCEWAMENGISPAIIAFLRCNPDYLIRSAPTLELVNSPNPRTWANLHTWVNARMRSDFRLATYAGCIGAEAAALFEAFEATIEDMPSPETVLIAPDSVEIPQSPSTLYALIGALAYYADENFGNVVRFAHRMQKEAQGEMAGMLIKDALRRHPHLLQSAEFVAVSTGPLADLIQ